MMKMFYWTQKSRKHSEVFQSEMQHIIQDLWPTKLLKGCYRPLYLSSCRPPVLLPVSPLPLSEGALLAAHTLAQRAAEGRVAHMAGEGVSWAPPCGGQREDAAESVAFIRLPLGHACLDLLAPHRGPVLGPGQGGSGRVEALSQTQQGGPPEPRGRRLGGHHQLQTGGRRGTSWEEEGDTI